jgi:hypothetical protein
MLFYYLVGMPACVIGVQIFVCLPNGIVPMLVLQQDSQANVQNVVLLLRSDVRYFWADAAGVFGWRGSQFEELCCFMI